MGERQLVREFENSFLFVYFPALYKYDYPDTGKRTYKEKPPDSLYVIDENVFLIEYKMLGNQVKKHQFVELLKAQDAGAFSFVATIYPDRNIVFTSVLFDKTYELKYDNGYRDLRQLFKNLIEVYK